MKLLWRNFAKNYFFCGQKTVFLVNYYFGQRKAGVKREVITSNYKKSKKKCLSNLLDCVTVLCRHLHKCVTSVLDLSSISTISQTTWRLCVIALSSLFTKPDLASTIQYLNSKRKNFLKREPREPYSFENSRGLKSLTLARFFFQVASQVVL